jgi:hypothetical protein
MKRYLSVRRQRSFIVSEITVRQRCESRSALLGVLRSPMLFKLSVRRAQAH